jgi:hypothetical protein
MQTSQAQPGNPALPAERVDQARALAGFFGFFSGLWGRRRRAEDGAAARYDGCAWCDWTEQQITHDLMTGRRS